MHPLDRVPAIRRIETDRPDVFAIEIIGEVTAADVENLCGLLEGAYALHDRLDLVVRATEFDEIVWDGVSSETTASVRDHATQHINRVAEIGDIDALREFERILKPAGDIERRRFDPAEEEDAWAWIGARPETETV
jgi:hypothetical protein